MTSPLGDELVKQNGASTQRSDAELGKLRQVIDAEQQRARRLARWTKLVWLAAAALLVVPVVMSVVYMNLSRASFEHVPQQRPAATQPSTSPAHVAAAAEASRLKTQAREMEAREGAIAAVMVTLMFLAIPGALLLVLIGIILLVMTFVARRTVGMHEVRARLASIDAQLRLLTAPQKSGRDNG